MSLSRTALSFHPPLARRDDHEQARSDFLFTLALILIILAAASLILLQVPIRLSGANTQAATPPIETIYMTVEPLERGGIPHLPSTATNEAARDIQPFLAANPVQSADTPAPVADDEPSLPSTIGTEYAKSNPAKVLGNVIASATPLIAEKMPTQPRPALTSQVVLGRAEESPAPRYPDLAKAARIEGEVVLRAIVDKDGRVAEVHVVSGHPMLTVAASDAVKRWRYQPSLLNGQPVEAETTVKINFTMPR